MRYMGTCPKHYTVWKRWISPYYMRTWTLLESHMAKGARIIKVGLYRYLQFCWQHVKFIDAVSSSRCLCPGDTISYECTITGTEVGSTVWTGTAFNDAEIVLLHSRFHQGTSETYRNSIVAKSLSVEGNNYTSQLNVTVTPDTAGKTIECIYDNGSHEIFIFSTIIPIITG